MFKRVLGAAAIAALMAGCVSVQNKPLNAAASEALEYKSLAYSVYPTPDFSAMTPGKAMFGMLGAAAMVSAGNHMVLENGVVDPALTITNKLASMLNAKRDMVVWKTPVRSKSDKVSTISSLAGSADYLLDVRTLNWMYSYYPSKIGHYRVFYAARLRLIDNHSKAVIAETLCKTQPNTDENAPTRDELLADHAARLKQLLDKAGNDCVGLLAKQILKI